MKKTKPAKRSKKPVEKPSKKRREVSPAKQRCSRCEKAGHNKRTCKA